MKNLKISLVSFLFLAAASCSQTGSESQSAKRIVESGGNVVTGVSKSEIDAAKDPCVEKADLAELEKCYQDDLKTSETELKSRFGEIVADIESKEKSGNNDAKSNLENLNKTQKAWENYRLLNCDSEAKSYEEGAARISAGVSCQKRLADERIDELKFIYQSR